MERQLAEREFLDAPGPTRSEIERNLRDISASNSWLGGTAVVMRHLTRMIGLPPGRLPVSILDLATGGADIPMAIVDWGRAHGIPVRIVAVDANPHVVEIARGNTEPYPEICVDLQDIRRLPYPAPSFDFVTCSLALHHLQSAEVIDVLRSSGEIARQGIVVSELHRRPFCTAVAWIGSHMVSNRLTKHDGQVSFRNAFTPSELERLAETAGLPACTVFRHGPCRLALVSDLRPDGKPGQR